MINYYGYKNIYNFKLFAFILLVSCMNNLTNLKNKMPLSSFYWLTNMKLKKKRHLFTPDIYSSTGGSFLLLMEIRGNSGRYPVSEIVRLQNGKVSFPFLESNQLHRLPLFLPPTNTTVVTWHYTKKIFILQSQDKSNLFLKYFFYPNL